MRQFLKQKKRNEQVRFSELHKQAKADAHLIVQHIIDTYYPKRIVQWGSVVHPKYFRDYSDIDIAVEGLTDPESYFRLLQEVEDITSFPVDIVQLEKIEPEYKCLILKKGVVVYER